MIEFSIPMYFEDDFISRIEELNNDMKKVKITSVYGCFPLNMKNYCGFEQLRVSNCDNVKSEDEFFEYVKIAQDAGLEFIYLLNSPRSMLPIEFYKSFDKINRFIELLLSKNIKVIRATNTQLIEHITNMYPEVEIRTSTSQEYTSLRQYRNLFAMFPNITEVIPSLDVNRNFAFLRNFKSCFDKRIELMANEGCLPGCPFRIQHHTMVLTGRDSEKPFMQDVDSKYCKNFFVDMCSRVFFKDMWRNIVMSNIIYPWDIDTYAKKYGIVKFKLAGRNLSKEYFIDGDYFELYNNYIRGVEDYDYIANKKFRYLSMYTAGLKSHPNFDFTVAQIRNYLPDISYFEKNGGKCANVCGSECRYCFNLAEKLNQKYPFN